MDTTIVSHVVLRCLAWNFSSSGVERTFARGSWCKANREVPTDLATDEISLVHFPVEERSEFLIFQLCHLNCLCQFTWPKIAFGKSFGLFNLKWVQPSYSRNESSEVDPPCPNGVGSQAALASFCEMDP